MSAYDNKYWSHRIAQLAEKVPETDDLSFFASEAYRDFTEQGVKDLICGTCTYLRTLGYDITKEQEEERINDMVVMMSTDENMTVCTNGDSMIIGVNNSLVKYFPNRELRHYAIQGLRVHETAHVLFTDFKTIDMWLGALRNGNWWPVVPDHAQDPDGAELTQVLSKKEFSKSFAAIAGRLENAIEDGFIEREIKEMYKGLATTELCTTNDAMLSMASTFGEFLKAGRSAYSAMFQQVLIYAKYDITMVDDMPEQYSDIFDACMEVVDDVKCERDVKKRLCGVNELCCILYPLFKEMLTKNTEKQNQQSSGSGNGKPGNSGFGLPQNSQGQQNGSNGQSDPNQNGNGSQNGSGNAQNNSSNGNGNSNSVDSMTAEQLSEALKEAVKQIEQAAKNVGVNNLPDRHSNSITNQASKSKDAKKRESGKQGSGNNAAIEKARKQEIATAQANNEANNQLAQEGAKIGSEIGTKISVRRAAEVPQSNIDTYNRLSAGLLSVTKNLERRLKTTIRDEENDDAVAGLKRVLPIIRMARFSAARISLAITRVWLSDTSAMSPARCPMKRLPLRFALLSSCRICVSGWNCPVISAGLLPVDIRGVLISLPMLTRMWTARTSIARPVWLVAAVLLRFRL